MANAISSIIDMDERDEHDPHWERLDNINLAIAQSAYFSKLSAQNRETFEYLYSVLHNIKEFPVSLAITIDAIDFAKKNNFFINGDEDKTLTLAFTAFRSLGENSNWLQYKGGIEVLVGWLTKVILDRNSKTITVSFDKTFAKYQYYLFENLCEV